MLTQHRKIKREEQTLTIKYVNRWVYVWLVSNPLVWMYQSEGDLLGLMDYARVEFTLKQQGLKLNPELFHAFQQVELGVKQQWDEIVRKAREK